MKDKMNSEMYSFYNVISTSKSEVLKMLESEFDPNKASGCLDVFIRGNFIEASKVANYKSCGSTVDGIRAVANYMEATGITDTKLKDVLKKCYDILFSHNVDTLEIYCYSSVPKANYKGINIEGLHYGVHTNLTPEEVYVINTKIKKSLKGIVSEEFIQVYSRRESKYMYFTNLWYSDGIYKIFIYTTYDPVRDSFSFRSIVIDKEDKVLKYMDVCSSTEDAFEVAHKYITENLCYR